VGYTFLVARIEGHGVVFAEGGCLGVLEVGRTCRWCSVVAEGGVGGLAAKTIENKIVGRAFYRRVEREKERVCLLV